MNSGPLGINLGPLLVNFVHLGVEFGSLRVDFRFLKTICTSDSRRWGYLVIDFGALGVNFCVWDSIRSIVFILLGVDVVPGVDFCDLCG